MTIAATAKKVLVDPCLRSDGTPDVLRISIALAVAAYIALSTYAVIRSGTFDMQSFGIGFGSLLAGGGGGAWMHANAPK